MTTSHLAGPIAGLVLLWSAGCGELTGAGFESDVSTVQVVSANVGGKNVYLPSTIVIVGGRPHTLSLYNTTETPHGFSIAGVGVEAVLPPGEETLVELPVLEGGAVHRIHCQLHEAHRTATLVVLPGG